MSGKAQGASQMRHFALLDRRQRLPANRSPRRLRGLAGSAGGLPGGPAGQAAGAVLALLVLLHRQRGADSGEDTALLRSEPQAGLREDRRDRSGGGLASGEVRPVDGRAAEPGGEDT